MAYSKTARDILDKPLSELSEAVSTLKDSEKSELSRELRDLATRSAAIAEYLETRGGMGCGDHGHADGVKQFNRMYKAVRKVLGFSYPAKGIINF